MDLHDVIIFRFEDKDRFAERIDAQKARLEKGYWKLENAWISGPLTQAQFRKQHKLRTKLTLTKIQESFASRDHVVMGSARVYRYHGSCWLLGP